VEIAGAVLFFFFVFLVRLSVGTVEGNSDGMLIFFFLLFLLGDSVEAELAVEEESDNVLI